MSFANLFVRSVFPSCVYCSCFTTLTFGLTFFVILFVICANIISYLLLDLLLLHLFYSVFKVQLVGSSGLEPPTLRLSGARSSLLSYEPILIGVSFLLSLGGDEEIRTLDPLLAGQVLSQLSYTPIPLGFLLYDYTLKIEQQIPISPLYSSFFTIVSLVTFFSKDSET